MQEDGRCAGVDVTACLYNEEAYFVDIRDI